MKERPIIFRGEEAREAAWDKERCKGCEVCQFEGDGGCDDWAKQIFDKGWHAATAHHAERLKEIEHERNTLKDDLDGYSNACFTCANSDDYGDPIRHYHEPEGWHWHHYLDPGDGLADPCKNSELLERVLAPELERLAAVESELERVKGQLATIAYFADGHTDHGNDKCALCLIEAQAKGELPIPDYTEGE